MSSLVAQNLIRKFLFVFEQVEKGGEDAYFVSRFGGGVLGIADGVSG